MNKFLKNKTVLFFSWPFYQYPEKIVETLQKYGAKVTYYCSAPTSDFMKVKLLERLEFFKKNYFDCIIKDISGKKFDYIFVINSAVFPSNFIKKLSSMFVNATKILYVWDSIEVYPRITETFDCFDRIYTFDSSDLKVDNRLNFLPLFYVDDLYDGKEDNINYDFSFIGFGHSERYDFINSIKEFADLNNYKYFFRLFLPSRLHFYRGKYIRKNLANAHIDDFYYKQTSQLEVKKITNQSRIVVDLELDNQSGLTMRTIETHGMRKKLITTNENIINYDFYDENNILIVDRKNPVISCAFVESKYKVLSEDIYDKYSLSCWIKTIFEDGKYENKCNFTNL